MSLITNVFQIRHRRGTRRLALRALGIAACFSAMAAGTQAHAQACSFPIDVGTESALNDAIACYNAAAVGD
ncbi:MAG: hypothetical protein AAGE85_09175, partial [Pseudomonadota bacterium]